MAGTEQPANPTQYPCSPHVETEGLPYFARMCEKIRLFAAGRLSPDLHENLGKAMDLWTCQFLGIAYEDLRRQVLAGATDQQALAWARQNGIQRSAFEQDWWIAFMKTAGFRDRLTGKLAQRKAEAGLSGRNDIQTMFDFMDADEGRP